MDNKENTAEEYIAEVLKAKEEIIPLLPNGCLPKENEVREAAIRLIRERRVSLENLARVTRIHAQAMYALEAQILTEADEEFRASLRKRDKNGEASKVAFNMDKRKAAYDSLISLGLSDEKIAKLNELVNAGKFDKGEKKS